jgi:hypothetical protein
VPTHASRSGPRRAVFGVAAAVLAFALLPLGSAQAAHNRTEDPPDPRDLAEACPEERVPDAGYTDIANLPDVFQRAINCIAWYGVGLGTTATTYSPDNPVRRDQMASFIARVMDRADALDDFDDENRFPCDVVETNPHYENINRLAEAGVVQGGPGGREADCFGPELQVIRQQMASFITEALRAIDSPPLPLPIFGDPYATDEVYFDDIEDADPHQDNINVLAEVGISNGTTVTEDDEWLYGPAQSTTRSQMALFLARMIDHLVEGGAIEPPGRVAIALDPDEGPAATEVEATVTGETESVEEITLSGDCVTEETEPLALEEDDTFTFAIDADADAGECEITFEVTFDDEETEEVVETFTVTDDEEETEEA